MRVTRKHFTAAAASLLVVAQIGCVTTGDEPLLKQDDSLLKKNISKKEPTFLERLPLIGKKNEVPEPYPNPVKLAATWTPDTLIQTGRTPTRGFGGRIFFYDERSRPVPVEGTLTIHGFDDSAASPEESLKRFVFTPEQFTRHFGQSDLGASYSIWVPWDAVGGEQKKISLVTSFTPVDGTPIQGVPSTLLLPGKDTDLRTSEEVALFSPQYREYLAATQNAATPTSGLTTTTIRRRRPDPVSIESKKRPAITIPRRSSGGQLIAGQNGTQSFDLEMRRRPTGPVRSSILPASAELPLQAE